MTRRGFFEYIGKHAAKPIGAGLAAAVAVLQYRADSADKNFGEIKDNLREDLKTIDQRIDYHSMDIAALKERTQTTQGATS